MAADLYGSGNETRVRTLDAIPLVAATIDLPPSSVGTVTVIVVARSPGGARGAWRLFVAGGRESAAPSAISPPVNVNTQLDIAAATWAVALIVTGNSIGIQLTGQAATTIDWLVITQEIVYAP